MTQIQHKRGLKATKPNALPGEIIFTTDTNEVFASGDGIVQKQIVTLDMLGANGVPTGSIFHGYFNYYPTGFLLLHGQGRTVNTGFSKTTYSVLWNSILTLDSSLATVSSSGTYSITSNVCTITASNSFSAGQIVNVTFTTGGATALSGYYTLTAATSGNFTFALSTTNTTGNCTYKNSIIITLTSNDTTNPGRFYNDQVNNKFGLPDFRNMFIRSLPSSGRNLADYQADAEQDHTHSTGTVNVMTTAGNAFAPTGSAFNYYANGYLTTISVGSPVGARIASETRPVNIALNAIIKY